MKSNFIFLMALFYSIIMFLGCKQVKSRPENTMSSDKISFYDYFASNPSAKVKSIDGDEVDFNQFNGKKVLIVNVASECGYTPQYEDLQKLYEANKDKLVILGFPANNFGRQEPGTNEEIKSFCKENYGVTFPMFEKISVIGDNQHPLYKWLTSTELNGWNNQAPTWNFCKYLIDENGGLIKYYSMRVKPFDEEIVSQLN